MREILPRCPRCGLKYQATRGDAGKCPTCAAKKNKKKTKN